MKSERTSITPAELVGQRIKNIRMSKGLSQGELGEMVGLNADRIQKYENGIRKPKEDMVIQIAKALGVNPLAIDNPYVLDEVSAMHMLFQLEDMCDDMGVHYIGGSYYISPYFRDGKFDEYFDAWCKRKMHSLFELSQRNLKPEEAERLEKQYDDWRWRFAESLDDEEYSPIDSKIEQTEIEIGQLQAYLELLKKSKEKRRVEDTTDSDTRL